MLETFAEQVEIAPRAPYISHHEKDKFTNTTAKNK